MFIPLLILACLPSFYQSSIFGMGEIEAVTRASAAQIILAKLILAGAAQIVCLTVICWFADVYKRQVQDPLVTERNHWMN